MAIVKNIHDIFWNLVSQFFKTIRFYLGPDHVQVNCRLKVNYITRKNLGWHKSTFQVKSVERIFFIDVREKTGILTRFFLHCLEKFGKSLIT